MKKVAVVTDLVNLDFFFPIWYRYYGGLFGPTNLHVVTYENTAGSLKHLPLGGEIRLPSIYNNDLRASFISSYCTTLLQHYDLVLRVDVDEMLVPDMQKYSNLREYLNGLDVPYVTAMGLDVVQHTAELVLDTARPLLVSQRSFAYPNTSLNKTCVTSVPTRWVPGFHYCTLYPKFHELFLFHLKLADIEQQLRWASEMLKAAPGDAHVAGRYLVDPAPILKYRNDVLARPLKENGEGMLRPEYIAKFFASIEMQTRAEKVLYVGKHFHDHILVKIPDAFSNAF